MNGFVVLSVEEIKSAVIRASNGKPIVGQTYASIADRAVPRVDFNINKIPDSLPSLQVLREISTVKACDFFDMACRRASINQIMAEAFFLSQQEAI